ncbi:MAG: hypothetical protein ACOYOV_06925 [Bacteroidales bacterium]
MKKIILFLLGFIFCCNFIYAQDCKYEKNEVDKFSGKKTLLTELLKISNKVKANTISVRKVEIQTRLVDDQRILSLKLTYNIDYGVILMAGTENLICILSNGEKIQLKLIVLGGNFGYYSYLIDDINYDELIKYDIKNIRVEAHMNGFDFTVMEGLSTTNIFKCIK